MKFYNRRSELAELQRIRDLALNDYSRLTVVHWEKKDWQNESHHKSG
ncbi:MAG: hypothetical protein AB2L20_25160 [Mangrovibacterium sp.]